MIYCRTCSFYQAKEALTNLHLRCNVSRLVYVPSLCYVSNQLPKEAEIERQMSTLKIHGPEFADVLRRHLRFIRVYMTNDWNSMAKIMIESLKYLLHSFPSAHTKRPIIGPALPS
jgi:hypothetical protein